MLAVPARPPFNAVRASQSQQSMKDLPETMEKLTVDRTANSTPASKHKIGEDTKKLSFSVPVLTSPDANTPPKILLTPPVDTKPDTVENDRNLQIAPVQSAQDTQGKIFFEAKAEDDVFRGDAHPKAESDSGAPVTDSGKRIPERVPEHIPELAANNTIAPRSDRLKEPITPLNAQGVLPPDALVFVANLSVSRTDEELEQSCRSAFGVFGPCIVKVRRDKHKHPFALIQYHVTSDAVRAVDEGRDLVINGRPVRTERAECRRSVVLSRVGGGNITAQEAEELLGKYGPIMEMQPTTHADGRLHGVPEGMWVKFAYYLDFKDCVKAFNHTTTIYQVIDPPNLEPRTRPTAVIGSPVVHQGLRTPRSTSDQKSIFVGNLPPDTAEAELREIFHEYGHITSCNVIRKPITGGQGFNVFGFLEFSTVAEADIASQTEIDVRGQRIRVEPKEYSARRHTRLQQYGQSPPRQRTPRGVPWRRSPNALRSPGAPLPYGWQPIYFQIPPGGLPQFGSNYTWTSTPPNSTQRPRTAMFEDFGGSPPQLFAMPPAAYSMLQTQVAESEDQDPQAYIPPRFRGPFPSINDMPAS